LYYACELARRQGMIIVAAAMEGDPSGGFPAAFEPVIGVRAAQVSNRYDIRYFAGQAHECGAQAVRQRGRGLGGIQREANGTSAAAPIVTGYIARLLEKEPGLDLDAVRVHLGAHRSESMTDLHA
jgi:subtilase family protein